MGQKNVFLTGFMGTGKTSVGRELARVTGREFIDTDADIEKAAGMSIPEIFSRYGEAEFRKQEKLALKRACSVSGRVIATGGGAVLDEENRRCMKQNGIVIALYASSGEIKGRVEREQGRPLLPQPSLEKIEHMMREREPYYNLADIGVDTTGCTVKDIVNRLLKKLKEEER